MKISFELTMDDWMAFQQHYLSTSKQYKRTRLFMIWVVPIIPKFKIEQNSDKIMDFINRKIIE